MNSSKNLYIQQKERGGGLNNRGNIIEYLKNVLLKYLEAISVGNEFNSKILESVIFQILNVPESERLKLEEKRQRSSFYKNLWFNAKSFLTSKIYGEQPHPDHNNTQINQTNNISLNCFRVSQQKVQEVMNSNGTVVRTSLDEMDIVSSKEKGSPGRRISNEI